MRSDFEWFIVFWLSPDHSKTEFGYFVYKDKKFSFQKLGTIADGSVWVYLNIHIVLYLY